MHSESQWYYVLARNPLAWIEFASTVLSIVAFLQGYYKASLIILICLLLIIAGACLYYYEKAYERKYALRRIRKCPEKLHDLIHDLRDVLTSDNILTLPKDSSEWISLVRRALRGLESCFKEITNDDCYASIMLQDKENSNEIVTSIRSLMESEERRKYNTPLHIGSGLAGIAFKTGDAQWSSCFKTDERFLGVRERFADFYQSGVSAPFKVNKIIHGVVNLDCNSRFPFDKECSLLVRSVADLIALIYQMQASK
ncbi:MAG: GAF domain-containing protein [Lentisphaerae bacterium]|nr:GAF domain-containing protein [Lentisphaerota bacterium]